MDRNPLQGAMIRNIRELLLNNNGLTLLSLNNCLLGEEGSYFIC